jgi:hypothetical protein
MTNEKPHQPKEKPHAPLLNLSPCLSQPMTTHRFPGPVEHTDQRETAQKLNQPKEKPHIPLPKPTSPPPTHTLTKAHKLKTTDTQHMHPIVIHTKKTICRILQHPQSHSRPLGRWYPLARPVVQVTFSSNIDEISAKILMSPIFFKANQGFRLLFMSLLSPVPLFMTIYGDPSVHWPSGINI